MGHTGLVLSSESGTSETVSSGINVKSSSCKSGNEVDEDPEFLSEPNDGLIPPPPAFRPPEKIEDVISFKHSLGLYPLVPPYVCIPPPLYVIPEKSKL